MSNEWIKTDLDGLTVYNWGLFEISNSFNDLNNWDLVKEGKYISEGTLKDMKGKANFISLVENN